MKRRYILIAFAAVILPYTLMAQAPEGVRSPREALKPEMKAKQRTDEMQVQLELSQKQYNKIYKFFLQEEKEQLQSRPNFGHHGPPPGGRREGGPPSDRNGDFSSERPQRPSGRLMGLHPEEMQKAAEKKEKRLKKILTAGQYEKWSSFEKEQERHKLPWDLKEVNPK